MRTDANNNPAAFTTDVAHSAGLIENTDYTAGDPFEAGGRTYYTARLIGDPVAITIRVIDAIGYYTKWGQRWTYIAMPKFIWDALTPDQKRDVVGFHYQREGGITMRVLFPNYGKP
jgi:hypothetical protein